MPHVSRELLREALQALNRDYSPLLIISLPCMLAKTIPTCGTAADAAKAAIDFGSADERIWLDTYFRPGGGPPDLPYYMPGTGEWVQELYPSRALQRRRKDFDGSVFFHPTLTKWALTTGAAKALREKVLGNKPPVPLIALMVWMLRDKEIESLDKALANFIADVGIKRDGLLGSVYSDDIPKTLEDAGLSDSPPSVEAIADLIDAAPPTPSVPELGSMISSLEKSLTDYNVELIAGLVGRIVGGWLVGDIVVLVGPTGSGKTFLAESLGRALQSLIGPDRFSTTFIPINRDYDVAQFLGYENLSGEFVAGKLTREALLAGAPSDPRLVVLDEWNLAQIDAYFAPILSVLETKRPVPMPGKIDPKKFPGEDIKRAQPELGNGSLLIPEDTLFIATCNSWLDEPETRLPISGPVKRRCRIIPIPNILAEKFTEKGNEGIAEICNKILSQEKNVLQQRAKSGRSSIWDSHRGQTLEKQPNFSAIQGDVRSKLLQLSRVLLENVDTKSGFTIGILRDVLLSCIYATADNGFRALGEQVADKLLHQIVGDPKVLKVIVDLCADFPNESEIRALAQRMGAFGSEKRIRPLV